jgi:hypothetical protein
MSEEGGAGTAHQDVGKNSQLVSAAKGRAPIHKDSVEAVYYFWSRRTSAVVCVGMFRVLGRG